MTVSEVLDDKGKEKILVKLSTQIKDGVLEINPNFSVFREIVTKNIARIVSEISKMKCISKTYIEDVRPNNLLRIFQTK